MRDIEILIASPSPVARVRLNRLLSSQADFDVTHMATNLTEVYNLAETYEPDLVLISEDLTNSENFPLTKALFDALDIRWVTFEPAQSHSRVSASTCSSGLFPADLSAQGDGICRQIRSICQVRRHKAPLPAGGKTGSARAAERLVLIGASTGGVDALIQIISSFPQDCPPTAIVQHTGRGFSESLVRLLDRRCAAKVVVGEDRMKIEQGMICVAASYDQHLQVEARKPFRCKLVSGGPVSGHLPSVDALFRSAVPLAKDVIGVLLTGMGKDGSHGLLELRQAGSETIAQDESTSIVYGMPKAAWELGAVKKRLGLGAIAGEILKTANGVAT
ncbi:MAG: chemotaxis protein CheB [Paracoccaceae bacterium]